MVTSKICVITVLLSLHAANSYILLTANVEDMHSLAKQIAASPVGNQLNKILNRASAIFNQHFSKGSKPQMRSNPNLESEESDGQDQKTMEKDEVKGTEDDVEVWKPNNKVMTAELNGQPSDSSSELSAEANAVQQAVKVGRRHQPGPDLIELGRNASFYLSSIKKIFENV
ncbi:uncharacterized protein LOC110380326 [Helicoverpa armigera]|uniref:uncharacterized protein LOC110380326 n=1 Tax=Helicoverpa armigera TaxID=29058 RepID=UPI003083C23D